MRAVTVVPKRSSSVALADIPEPEESEGSVLVETLAVGVCGTDVEIVNGDYGWSPPGRTSLVLGHESLGRVVEAPADSAVVEGDLVVCIVRRPDPVPCYACAVGQWDACRNGLYTEHGIKELDGFMRERYRSDPGALVTIDPALAELGVLLEPTTVVAKAWAQVEAIGNRVAWKPERCLVVGAGPIGLLAALLARQRGLETTVVDRVDTGLKPDLVRELGATYHSGSLASLKGSADVVIECTGVASLVLDSLAAAAIGGVVCLTGISPVGTTESADFGELARAMVLGNVTVVGSVNANRDHYEAGAQALHAAEEWLRAADHAAGADRALRRGAAAQSRRREGGHRDRRDMTRELAPGVVEIDTLLGGWRETTAGYLIGTAHPVLIETGSQSSVPTVLAALGGLGLGPADLAGIALTHIHLDHAGGVGDLAAAFPKATVYVHELGARHLIDPSRLVASAARVYGDNLDNLYGRLEPTAAERVVVLREGELLPVGDRRIEAIDSPGHAKHHLGFFDEESGLLFAGDAVGVRLPDIGVLRPATPPPDFDLELALTSLERFAARRPRAIVLAHFGVVPGAAVDVLSEAGETLRRWAGVAERAYRSGGDIALELEGAFGGDFSELPEAARRRAETLNGIHSNAAGFRRWPRAARGGRGALEAGEGRPQGVEVGAAARCCPRRRVLPVEATVEEADQPLGRDRELTLSGAVARDELGLLPKGQQEVALGGGGVDEQRRRRLLAAVEPGDATGKDVDEERRRRRRDRRRRVEGDRDVPAVHGVLTEAHQRRTLDVEDASAEERNA